MKQKIKYIICALFTAGFIFSQQLYAQSVTKSISLYADSLELIGIIHNQGLDSILVAAQREKVRLYEESGIQITKDSPVELRKQFTKVAYDAMVKFMKSAYFCEQIINNQKDLNLCEQIVNNMIISEDYFMSGEKPSWGKINQIISKTSTPFQKEYYDKLQEIIRNSDAVSLAQTEKSIRELENRIKAETPSREEALIPLASAITARYSLQYWSSRLLEWRALFLPLTNYPNLTAEENKVIFGKAPGLYLHPSDSTKYIMFTPAGEVSVKQCPAGQVFYERIKNCMPVELLDSSKKILEGNESEIKHYDKLMESLNPAKNQTKL